MGRIPSLSQGQPHLVHGGVLEERHGAWIKRHAVELRRGDPAATALGFATEIS